MCNLYRMEDKDWVAKWAQDPGALGGGKGIGPTIAERRSRHFVPRGLRIDDRVEIRRADRAGKHAVTWGKLKARADREA